MRDLGSLRPSEEWVAEARAAKSEKEARVFALYAGTNAATEGKETGECPFARHEGVLRDQWLFGFKTARRARRMDGLDEWWRQHKKRFWRERIKA